MAEICGDNRFEIIEAAKGRLLDATNIEQAPDEMAVLDSLLFRMWQMGWLPGQERTCKQEWRDGTDWPYCSKCGRLLGPNFPYFPSCGARVVGD